MKLFVREYSSRLLFRKLLLVMKLTTLLILIAALHVSAKGDAQKVSLRGKNVLLAAVFSNIRQQTGYVFIYSDKDMARAKPVSLSVKDVSIKIVLDEVLKNQPLTYEIQAKTVFISAKTISNVELKPAGNILLSPPLPPSIDIRGRVTDSAGNPIPNANIQIKGTSKGIVTNEKGEFSLKGVSNTATLVISFVGYVSREIPVDNRKEINIILVERTAGLNDVVIVGYGAQKKITLVSAVTSVSTKDIKGPTSNLTTMLAGRIPGLISFQRSGEPGQDNAQFFIRGVGTFGAGKVDPLILIDGIESSTTDLARLQPDDIAGFSVLKDATATSVYGARGANGVILITTKVGQTSKMQFNVRLENSSSMNTKNIQLADNITYMNLANESVITRNPLNAIIYQQNKIDHTAKGDDPLLYPDNDWIKQLITPVTNNQRANMNISGGVADKTKYYLSMSYNLDNGNLKQNNLNGFSNNIKLQSFSVLSNVSMNFTKTTEGLVSIKGEFDNYNGPIGGGAAIYNNALWGNPVQFPAIYPQSLVPYAKHPLFGNAVIPGTTDQLYRNPYAMSLSGFQSYHNSTLTAQFSLKQNFNFITPGLSARVMAYIARYSSFSVTRQVSPYYYSSNILDGKLMGINLINDGSSGNPFPVPTEYLTYSPGTSTLNGTTYAEVAVNYDRVLGKKHSIGGMLIGTIRNYLTGNAGDLQTSLPSRNEGVSGRYTYGYDNRYLIEFDFGYNGSERFAQNHRFGFFPSVGGGWVASNEKFFEPLLKTVNNLKFRFTYGLVGNDQIGNSNDRFFYLSNVNLNGGGAGNFGTNFSYSRPTVSTGRYANPDISWEKSKQLNLGLDVTLLHDFKITIDAYHQNRTSILMSRSTIPSTMGLQATPSANVGQAISKGIDIALDYLRTINKNLWIQARGTFTYATNKVTVNEEPVYAANNKNLSHVGHPVNQIYGLVGERLFIDQVEVNNSPVQFGNIMAGDIKYRDVNGDGTISTNDAVPIGLPTIPEIDYGGGFTIGYKSFDLSAFFQGIGRTSFLIDPNLIQPFIGQNGLLSVIANSHWSEDNRNQYALWPRLNYLTSTNNNQASSWWLRNGAFMRLKSAELGYNMKASLVQKWNLRSVRFYLNGTNLLTFSAFKLWDPEMGSSGLGYPVQRVVNVGASVGF